MKHAILCIGASDSSAGTGIQADIKTALAYKVYATTCITVVASQNTRGIAKSHVLPADMVIAQIKTVIDDFEPTVVKLGMLGSTEIIDAVGDFLDVYGEKLRVVIDPVMTNRAENILLEKKAKDALKRRLLIHADFLTPNVSEISELTGAHIKDVDQLTHAAEMLHTLGAKVVVAKGAEIPGETFQDIYLDEYGPVMLGCQRAPSKNTHGAGTTLASGIACGLALGMENYKAFQTAHDFMTQAIEAGPRFGKGVHGPLNHTLRLPVGDDL
jgi:hydroxymethylpyrimidine/phosphomethylpyrimidine kinase